MRYSRQLAIPEIGVQGQARLQHGRVTIVGAGGLGTPASLYLAAAGVGRITIIDPDTVSMSNLNRQVLYDPEQLGASKALLLADRLKRFNPEIEVHGLSLRLTAGNAGQYLNRDGCDVVVDATDNNQTRLVLNKMAVQAELPLIYGGVQSFYGQVMTIVPGKGPCLGCLLPNPEAVPPDEPHGAVCQPDDFSACLTEEGGGAMGSGQHKDGGEHRVGREHKDGRGHRDGGDYESGADPDHGGIPVLGAIAGIVGSLEAAETLKIILGTGTSLIGRLLVINALDMRWNEVPVRQDPACPVCAPQ